MAEPGGDARTEGRLARARQILVSGGLDALLVSDLLNVRYLCGFTGSNALLLIFPDQALFYTDSRYTLQAAEETRGVEVLERKELDAPACEDLLKSGVKRVGLEERSLPVGRWRKIVELLPGTELTDASDLLDRLRVSKDGQELEALRAAAGAAEQALLRVLQKIAPGVTEAEASVAFQTEALHLGVDSLAFDTIVAGGPRGALPHAKPGNRAFAPGDLVVVDFGVRLNGYCSDETVTVAVGRVEAEARHVYDLVFRAQQAALAVIRPGVSLLDVDKAARDVITEAGYGPHFGHGTGHGVGLAVHEAPTVSTRSKEVAEAGMVFTVEPGIYLPGRFGVRLEDTVRVTADGYERITEAPKEFGAIWDWAR